ncbi:MAG: hypothetical protein CL943_02275 [Candidatus Diapherotrites archaeon]|uniref:N-acetyltransferase domain-containing protein n=1 Tax=Candidatus Iainarchaeum sp. TaxID=3101447 RepID=A0A2D6M101_9ARCH|nr:hypothetical protein [Candidatus Diapherotrites archaeon]|tara:strand:+ start:440 stop:868 length:429 start_codon:yes stop_codon:yes gene_type:complete
MEIVYAHVLRDDLLDQLVEAWREYKRETGFRTPDIPKERFKGIPIAVAISGNKVIGFIEGHPKAGVVNKLYIRAGNRKQGVGTALMRNFAQQAMAHHQQIKATGPFSGPGLTFLKKIGGQRKQGQNMFELPANSIKWRRKPK